MVQILQEAIPLDYLPETNISINDQTHLTGLVRGAKKKFKSRIGKWIRMDELVNVMWSTRRVNVARGILALCAADSNSFRTSNGGPPWRVHRHGDMANMDFCVAWPQQEHRRAHWRF